jgi:exodeoxyribonuclease VII small subunit
MAKEKRQKFEEALKRLEEIVSLMEDEKLPLEKALQYYEEGVRLTRFCRQTLDAAEKKIEILSKSADGQVTSEPFTSGEGEEQPGEGADGLPDARGREITSEERDPGLLF